MTKNRKLRTIVTWLIIVSPIWWTTGCYTTREITRPDEPSERDILVETRGAQIVILLKGHLDSLGCLSGETLHPKTGERTPISIPRDSIRKAYFGDAIVLTETEQSLEYENLTLDSLGRLSGNVRVYANLGEHRVVIGKTFTVLPIGNVKSVSIETFSVLKSVLSGMGIAILTVAAAGAMFVYVITGGTMRLGY